MSALLLVLKLRKTFSFAFALFVSNVSFSQNQDSTQHLLNVSGAASVTNNGFSFVPAFSLGKPAAIFNFNVNSGKRLSFEPEFRFSITDGKPWSFIFIWRYKLIKTPTFQLIAGAHLPALPFRTIDYTRNGTSYKTLATYRFLPFELSPTVNLNKNASLTLFCLYSYGFADATRHTNLVSLRGVFNNIGLTDKYFLRFNPQLFYLRTDTKEGYYAASSLSLVKKGLPFSVSTMMNLPLKTTIPSATGKNFDWNVSLVYAFAKSYKR